MLMQAHREGGGVGPTHLATLGLEEGGWSTSRPGRFTPGKDSVSIVQEAGWGSGPVWTARKVSPTRGFDPRTVQPVYRLRFYFAFVKMKCGFRTSGTLNSSAIISAPPPPQNCIVAVFCNGWQTVIVHTSCLCLCCITAPNFTCLLSVIINYLHQTDS
jgi:hypothetical protein